MKSICLSIVALGVAALPAAAQVRLSHTASTPPPSQGAEAAGAAADGTTVLWDQTDFGLHGWLDQVFTDLPASSGFQVNDVSTDGDTWKVTKVTTYYTRGIAGSWAPGSITTGNLQVFPKTGALPDDGGDVAPEHVVPITLAGQGPNLWRVEADTSGIAELDSITGDFWIGLTPITDFSVDGQEYHWVASVVDDETAFRNPGGDFGLGTGWLGLSAVDAAPPIGPPYEAAIRLEGENLTNTWVDLGPSTALISAFWGEVPTCEGTGEPSAGSTVTLSATYCGPSFAGTTLVIGIANISLPFKGGTMVPSPDLLVSLPTGPQGDLAVPFTWPGGLPAGLKLYLQFWQNEPPWSATNALEVTAL